MKIDIGLNENQRNEIVQGLSHLLADTYGLYLKTHNYHWNVTGQMFQTLHTMFETQYTELAMAVDEIAERIRTLGAFAPGSYSEFSKLSQIKEAHGRLNAKEMVSDLVHGHEIIIKNAKEIITSIEKAKDEASLDLLTQRIQMHEKRAWMLRSILED